MGLTRIHQISMLAECIEELNNDTCITCGDFNLVQDQFLDNYNYLHVNNPRGERIYFNNKGRVRINLPI